MHGAKGDGVNRPRYPKYKPSGVDWLGEVPEHWETKKISHIFKSVGSGTTPPAGEQEWYDDGTVPWVTTGELRESIITDTASRVTEQAVRNFSALKIHPAGSLAIAMYGATIGRLGIFGIAATTNQACCVLSGSTVVSPTFLYYWFLAYKGRLIDLYATGGGQPNINQDTIKGLRIPAPSLPEQRAIADFLDRETGRIDTLVGKKRELIARLKEKRAALITRAVTRGLDPAAKLKDSGVAWLGMVPEGWEVVRLKFLATVQAGITKGKDYQGHETIEVPYLRVANVQDGYLDLNDLATIEVPPSEVPRYLLRPGDVLMNEGGDYDKLGRGHVWSGEVTPCIHQNHVFAVRPHGVPSKWLNTFTGSTAAQFYFMERSKQSTNLASLSSRNLMEISVSLPPPGEMMIILDYLDRETGKLDRLTASVEAAIERLSEYRAALITAAVTGKIDVRETPAKEAA